MNNSAQCGGLVYTIVSSFASDLIFDDVFTSGKASFDSVDTLRFENIQNYPTGDLSVTMKVWRQVAGQATEDPVEMAFILNLVDTSSCILSE